MAISFYAKGELSSGFHGWRVVVAIRGKRYQKYFSARCLNTSIPEELWHRYQETRARYYDARWMARSAAIQYLDFLNQNHPNTRPHRGVGFQGITLGIGSDKQSAKEQCYFAVNKRGRAAKFYIDEECSLTEAWERAVNHWGGMFEIRPKDIARKITEVPSPDQFKALRHHLNEQEKHDLPASVLHYVYAEKRERLEKQKARKNTQADLRQDDLLSMYAHLEKEISQFQK